METLQIPGRHHLSDVPTRGASKRRAWRIVIVLSTGAYVLAVSACSSGSGASGGGPQDGSADSMWSDGPEISDGGLRDGPGRDAAPDAPDAQGTEGSVDAGVDADAAGNPDGTSPVPLVGGQSYPTRLTVTGQDVVWIDFGADPSSGTSDAGAIMRCAVGGCQDAPDALASGQTSPRGIAADSTAVYWTTPQAVMSVPLSGGAVTTIASQQPDAFGVCIDATNVYWTTAASILAMPRGGGAITTLAAGENGPEWIVTDGTNVYWTVYGGGQIGTGAVLQCAVGGCGGTPVTLASSLSGPYDIAVDGTNVYWSGPSIVRTAIGGGAAVTLAVPGGLGVAVDPSTVYWADQQHVKAVPIGGGTMVTLFAQPRPVYVAVGSARVYWTDVAQGVIWSVPR